MLPPCHDKYIEKKNLHQLREEVRTSNLFQVSFCLVHLVGFFSVFLISVCLLEIMEFLRLEKTSKVIQKHWKNQTLFREHSVEEQTYSTHVLTTAGTLWRHFEKGLPGPWCSVFCSLESWGFLSLFGWISHVHITEGLTVLSSDYFRSCYSGLGSTSGSWWDLRQVIETWICSVFKSKLDKAVWKAGDSWNSIHFLSLSCKSVNVRCC